MGGKGGGGSSSKEAGRAARDLSRIAQRLEAETRPIRRASLGRLEGTLAGQFPSGPVFEGAKLATEQQFDRAREATIAGAPAGGALTGALADIEAALAALTT